MRICRVLSVFFLLGIFSCEGTIEPYNKELILYASYSNLPNSSASVVFDLSKSSRGINISNSSVIQTNGNRINVIFDDVRFADELGVYEVNSIVTEEFRRGSWERDFENFLFAESSVQLDVVLVLDVSTSLGDNIGNVKSYAIDFIKTIKERNPNSKIGIIGFSQQIDSFQISENINGAINFISSLPSSDATTLFEAMHKGYSMLNNSNAEGKALITFTDGINNAWSDLSFENENLILGDLINSDITSFTIGLKGQGNSIDEPVLQKLALNNGIYEFPESIEDLDKVFDKFAASVASVYSLVYDRNDSKASSSIELRFRVDTKLN